MEFVKVESSQIDSVGFGGGLYGRETLGVRFKSKSGITEYHYQNVTPQILFEMMSSPSIGAYFTQNIKRNPALYPFVKVENENPTQPIQQMDGITSSTTQTPTETADGTDTNIKGNPAYPFVKVENENPTPPRPTTQATATGTILHSDGGTIKTISEPSMTSETIDNPGSALALIDTMEDDKLFAPGGVTDAQLEAGRQWYLAEAKKRDISTEKSRAEFKRFARPLQKLRTGIEARAKEFTGETKRKIAAIDTEKRRLVQIVGGIEDEVLGPLTAWEKEEESRKTHLANQVKAIEAKCDFFSYHDIPSLEAAIAEVEEFDITTMQEYRLSAESAKEAVLRRLRPELERRKVAEAERLELEQLRAERIAAAERERMAEQQRQEQERIDLAAEKLAQAKIQQAVEATKVETWQEVIAELAAPVVEEPDGPGEDEPYEPQPSETEPERVPTPVFRRDPIQAQGGIVETHEQVFNREAVAGLIGHVNLDRQTAIRVLTAIKAGNVPHVTITY